MDSRRISCGFLVSMHSAAILAAPPALEYVNQSTAKPFNRSAIMTHDGKKYWDFQFDATVNAAVGDKYKQMVFAFNECFGGGMIDELVARDLKAAAFTSAARHDQVSYSRTEDSSSGIDTNFPAIRSSESTYSLRWAPRAGGANPATQKSAATIARKQDIAGPFSDTVAGTFALGGQTSPQYTSTGAAGDRIRLHRGADGTKYRAILFAGSTQLDEGPARNAMGAGYTNGKLAANWNTLLRMHSSLIAAGYTEDEIYVMYPGGHTRNAMGNPTGKIYPGGPAIPNWVDGGTRYEDLRASWTTWMAGQTDANTQIFFWSSYGHGTAMTDVKAQKDAAANPKIKKGEAFSWEMDTDLGSTISHVWDYNSTITMEDDAYGLPYFLVETVDAIPALSIELNGAPLNLIASEINPLGGQTYKFELPTSAITQLQSSMQDLVVGWDFGPGPDPYSDEATFITMMGPTAGDFANGINVPAPGPLACIGMLALGARRRRSRA